MVPPIGNSRDNLRGNCEGGNPVPGGEENYGALVRGGTVCSDKCIGKRPACTLRNREGNLFSKNFRRPTDGRGSR